MGKQQRGRGTKYDDAFKRQLVAESHADGVSVPMVSKRHGVTTSRIYACHSKPRHRHRRSTPTASRPQKASLRVKVRKQRTAGA
ncbi:transposase [Halocynthiibacter namhaensis]|uniref:transposase n=1 Tax=Halocynthiibacter namhaensis TaxID=1290553 RepID=UPI001EE210D1|nr:transposase [Halocynthiibacter namhaensis]